MKRIYLILLALPFLSKCASNENYNELLKGEWTSHSKPDQGNVVFSRDSVYYQYYQKSFPYTISKDSLTISLYDKTFKAKYYLKGDSLFLYHEQGIDTSFRKL
jgi:hypothetical protein